MLSARADTLAIATPADTEALAQAVAEGVGGGLGPAVRADLQVDVGDVALHRARAEAERLRDPLAAVARRQQAQHLRLAAREAARRRTARLATIVLVFGVALIPAASAPG